MLTRSNENAEEFWGGIHQAIRHKFLASMKICWQVLVNSSFWQILFFPVIIKTFNVIVSFYSEMRKKSEQNKMSKNDPERGVMSFARFKNDFLWHKLMRLGVTNRIVVVKSNLESKIYHRFRSDSKSNN